MSRICCLAHERRSITAITKDNIKVSSSSFLSGKPCLEEYQFQVGPQAGVPGVALQSCESRAIDKDILDLSSLNQFVLSLVLFDFEFIVWLLKEVRARTYFTQPFPAFFHN